MSPYFLGVDGGGTKTASVVIDASGKVISEGMGGPANAFHSPSQIVEQSVRDSIDMVLQDIKAPIANTVCNLPTREGIQIIIDRTAPANVEHVGERAIVLAAAGFMGDVGIAVVAGTGSSVQGRAQDGRVYNLGGWGSLLGDEGGAYDIALRAIKHALRCFDGRELHCPLADHLIDYFGPFTSQTAFTMSGQISRMPREMLAGFAVHVSDAAAQGDEFAKHILREAGLNLGGDAVFVAKELFAEADEFAVVLSGGVFKAGDLVVEPLSEVLKQAFTNANICLTSVSPAEGAARVAKEKYEKQANL